jgi:hypothetical protein
METKIELSLTDDEVELLRQLTIPPSPVSGGAREMLQLNTKIVNALLDAGYKKKQKPMIY